MLMVIPSSSLSIAQDVGKQHMCHSLINSKTPRNIIFSIRTCAFFLLLSTASHWGALVTVSDSLHASVAGATPFSEDSLSLSLPLYLLLSSITRSQWQPWQRFPTHLYVVFVFLFFRENNRKKMKPGIYCVGENHRFLSHLGISSPHEAKL